MSELKDHKDDTTKSFQDIDEREHDDGKMEKSFDSIDEREHDDGKITLGEK